MGKGSKRRPTDEAKFRENWDRIFGAKEEIVCEPVVEVERTRIEIQDTLGGEPIYKTQTFTAPPDDAGTPPWGQQEEGR